TELGLIALDGATGERRWSFTEGDGERTAAGLPVQAPRGSPVVLPDAEGATVFASLPSAPAVVALNAVDGSLKWRIDVGQQNFAEAWRTNPILAGDGLVVGPTGADLSPVPGRLTALDVETGEIAWNFDLVPLADDDPVRDSWSPYPPGRSYGVGGASAWNAGAYDPLTGTIIYGTGQPLPADQLDPRRFDGDGPVTADLYTASFVA